MPPKKQPVDNIAALVSELTSSEAFADLVEGLVKKAVKEVIGEELQLLTHRIEEQEGKLLDLENKIRNQNEEIQRLKSCVNKASNAGDFAKRRLNQLEQYTRRNSLRIHGLPESAQESTDALVCKLAEEKLGIKVTPDEIDRSHRVSSPSSNTQQKPRQIIVKFCSYRTRSSLMKARSKLKGTNIYLNEDLTKENQALYYAARHNSKVKQSWTIDGRIFVEIINSAGGVTKKLITCVQDLESL